MFERGKYKKTYSLGDIKEKHAIDEFEVFIDKYREALNNRKISRTNKPQKEPRISVRILESLYNNPGQTERQLLESTGARDQQSMAVSLRNLLSKGEIRRIKPEKGSYQYYLGN